jgi:hypothetical protein
MILNRKFILLRLLHQHLHEEDVMFKEEEIALNVFEIGFETWVTVSARRGLVLQLFTKMKINRPLETS